MEIEFLSCWAVRPDAVALSRTEEKVYALAAAAWLDAAVKARRS